VIAYLLASLPTPRLGAIPMTEPGGFLARCHGFVSDGRLHDLADVIGEPLPAELAGPGPLDIEPPGAPSPLGGEDRDDEARAPHAGGLPEGRHDAATLAWWTLIAHVDDAVVHERARRARRDPRAALRGPPGFRFDIVEWVAQAFERPHPGARERALDELRWRLADELAVAHPGTFGALVAHAAQLRLAWRWARWNAEEGVNALEAALRRIEGSLA
jgi:hypothetical protein